MYSKDEYRRAYVEVLAVIATLEKENYEKIPKDRIEHMEDEKDKEYVFEFDKNVLIKDQVSQLSKELLAYIFFNYMVDTNKRIEIQRKKEQLRNKKNLKNLELKNIELKPLFEKKEEIKQKENKELIVKRESLFDKIIGKIKSIIYKITNKN